MNTPRCTPRLISDEGIAERVMANEAAFSQTKRRHWSNQALDALKNEADPLTDLPRRKEIPHDN